MQFYFSAETDVNTGKRWSEMDIEDLTTFATQMDVIEMATFLCRSREEVFEKSAELGIKLKGEGQG